MVLPKKVEIKNPEQDNSNSLEDEYQSFDEKKIEDPLFKFLYKWRNVIMYMVVIGVCGTFIWDKIQTYQYEASQQSSDLFEQFRGDFELATQPDLSKEKSEEVLFRVNEKIKSLESEKSPYSVLAKSYAALLATRRGEAKEIDETVFNEKVDDKPLTSTKLFDEMSALLLARSQMDDSSTREKGMKNLIELAKSKNIQYVNVVAGLTAARLAISDSEKNDAKEVLSLLINSHPEFSDEINAVLKKMN